MEISTKQAEALQHVTGPDRNFIAVGAVRSGKTVACGMAFAMRAALVPDHNHVILGVTEPLILRTLVYPRIGIISYLKSRGFRAYVSGVGGTHISIARPNGGMTRIFLIGANTLGAVDRIAGPEYASALVDEAARIPEEAWHMLQTRLSVEGAKLWATLNPAEQRHWLKDKVIDRARQTYSKVVYYTMDDNPSLTETVKRQIVASVPKGHWRTRLIDGKFADATGVIYPHWRYGELTAESQIKDWSIGLDWAAAGSSKFAAIMFANLKDGTSIAAYERFHDGSLQTLTDAQQAQFTADWAREHTSQSRITVIGDPSTPPGFQQELQRHGLIWQDGDNDVMPGIQATSTAFQRGDLRVSRNCRNLVGELGSYIWDPKAAERAETKPLKKHDDGLDAVRYHIHTKRHYFEFA